ncbi:hypothetical protein GCM10025855_16140 [Shewanella glacialipiscicola]|uniref:UmuC domain-containing protein n=2 Tax=Shewanella glacialipiscicola TaxID=614069 RepID=A0ABQ6J3J3_9GAMM|nr:hypothetical protein GCM10025855_16140 [Shewanella glacialipiscicola]
MFALVDANSFYCSAEQVFRPDWRGKPMIVLSNNDGCIVAANKQAKELGVPKFAPYFQVKDLCTKLGVIVCSSNYELTVGNFFRCHMLEFFMINKLDEEKIGSYSFTVCLDILKK